MITNAKVFRPEYPPRDLYHREGQLDHLSSVLDPTRVGRPEDVCIFGPSGAGKTTIAKYTLGQLEKEALNLRWAYVNCMADNTPAAVLFEIIRETGLGADLKREGTASSEAVRRLRECDDHIIVVLDEVGSIDDQPLLALWNVPNVSLICITIDEDKWFTELSTKTKSRMQSAETVRMDKYRHTELVDIIDGRVEHGLVGSRLADGVIDYIADLAAGDARHAIALLRQAALHVERNESNQLTKPVVDAVADDAASEIRDRNIRSLGSHHRLLLRIIRDADGIDSGTLHARYEDRAQSPKARSTRRRYLRSLCQSDLIERDGSTQDSRYRPLC
ncbi:Cdc6/Cdc18 family protein [Halomicrobium sp. HM KBTZ05]|uniref:AAA family ATPase n=1 Tax=Halomicrobium mukohataei TaxID=57705 RepID=A0A847UHF1_9EURY|nr:Cdc6/Cdc18 family protein [Halomicrobium mukohataei]NLV10681.1 AAA family ATPase [Halomicrobium mukohataei]